MKQILEYNGKKISYTKQGSGNSLVFIHGYLEYKEIWTDFIQSFIKNYKVLCIDLPGHGESESISEIHTMKNMARVVKQILDKEDIKESTIIGHSMGGYVSLAFANLFPKNTSSIVLFSSSALNDSTEKILARNRDIELIKTEKKQLLIDNNIPKMFATNNLVKYNNLINTIKEESHQMSNTGIIAALEGMKTRLNYTEFLKTTSIPILFIAGVLDELIQIDVSKRQVTNCKSVTYKTLEHSGHMGYIEEKELSAKYITDFLKTI